MHALEKYIVSNRIRLQAADVDSIEDTWRSGVAGIKRRAVICPFLEPVLALSLDPERCEGFQRISSAFQSKLGIISFWLRAHALNWVIFSSIDEVLAEFPRTDPQSPFANTG